MTRFGIQIHIRPLTLTINGLYETWYIRHINKYCGFHCRCFLPPPPWRRHALLSLRPCASPLKNLEQTWETERWTLVNCWQVHYHGLRRKSWPPWGEMIFEVIFSAPAFPRGFSSIFSQIRTKINPIWASNQTISHYNHLFNAWKL